MVSTPFEKYVRQNGFIFPKFRDENNKNMWVATTYSYITVIIFHLRNSQTQPGVFFGRYIFSPVPHHSLPGTSASPRVSKLHLWQVAVNNCDDLMATWHRTSCKRCLRIFSFLGAFGENEGHGDFFSGIDLERLLKKYLGIWDFGRRPIKQTDLKHEEFRNVTVVILHKDVYRFTGCTQDFCIIR